MTTITKYFGSRAAAIEKVRTVDFAPRAPVLEKSVLEKAGLHTGMWVTTDAGTVGVVRAAHANGLVEVTVFKANGDALMGLDPANNTVPVTVAVPADTLRRSYLEEIPHARRPRDPAALRAAGYTSRADA